MPARYEAVLFDLLTALLDSWSLWNGVAGDAEAGRRWRAAYLRLTYGTGAYRPYEALVAAAALEVGLPAHHATRLAARYDRIEPWPEVAAVLGVLAATLPLGIVTNCSEALAARAIARLPAEFKVVVTAERAGFYKPHGRPYELALSELGVPADRCLFVAGSAYDLAGTAALGLPTYWHDRIGMPLSPGAAPPLRRERTLRPLVGLVLGQAP
jgi:2-haloalkanoic acid dehalogenase type II